MYANIAKPDEFYERNGFTIYELEISLNGKPLVGCCVEADDQMGFVRVTDSNHISLDGHELVYQRLYGKVAMNRREIPQ